MRATVAAALLVALAACSPNLEGAKCSDDTNCPSGQRCGFDATCRTGATRYGVTLAAPPSGTIVGPSGVTLEATVVRASGVPDSGNPTLVAGSTNVTCSPKGAPGPTSSTYNCSYTPPAATDSVVSVSASAGSGADLSQSASVNLVVDTVAPTVSAVTLQCSASPSCTRDATLTVSATVADTHLSTVSASIGPGALATVSLASTSGSTYQGTVALAQRSFPFFEQNLTATVTGTDTGGNSASSSSSSLKVTRLRWSVAVESSSPPALTGAAIDAAGTRLYFGGDNGKVHVRDAVTGAAVTSFQPTTSAINASPSIGTSALWVGASDYKVYALNPADGSVLNGTGCLTLGPVLVTPAVLDNGTDPETAFVGSSSGASTALYEARTTECTSPTPISSTPFGGAPVIDVNRNVYAVIGTYLHSYQYKLGGSTWTWSENWGSAVNVGSIIAPLAIDKGPLIWTAASDTNGTLRATSTGGLGAVGPVTTGPSPDAPVVDAGGNVIVGDQNGKLYKFSSTGTALWSSPPTLDGGHANRSALVLSDGASNYYLVPTAAGTLFAVDKDGNVVWSGVLTTNNKALSEGNVVGKSTDSFTTAVFGGADGTVYGVIVDGHLDNTAPWPKAHHDPANTGNAATVLP